MSISENKTRMSLVLEKKDKALLEDIAKKQERSVNYCICKAIKQYISNNSSTEKGGTE